MVWFYSVCVIISVILCTQRLQIKHSGVTGGCDVICNPSTRVLEKSYFQMMCGAGGHNIHCFLFKKNQKKPLFLGRARRRGRGRRRRRGRRKSLSSIFRAWMCSGSLLPGPRFLLTSRSCACAINHAVGWRAPVTTRAHSAVIYGPWAERTPALHHHHTPLQRRNRGQGQGDIARCVRTRHLRVPDYGAAITPHLSKKKHRAR